MSAAPKVEPGISELLTAKEISQRYPDQWVYCVDYRLADPDDDDSAVTHMRVAACGRSRAEATEGARYVDGRYDFTGCHFTGKIRLPFGLLPLRGLM